jgi:CHAT domain-containing protein
MKNNTINNVLTASIYNNIGSAYYFLYKDMKSIKYLKKSLKILKNKLGKQHILIAENYNNLARFYMTKRLYQKAYSHIDNSLKIYIKNIDKNLLILNPKDRENYINSIINNIEFFLHISNQYSLYLKQKSNFGTNKKLLFEIMNNWLNYKGSIFDSENSISTLYQNTKDQILKDKIKMLKDNQRALANLYQNIAKDLKKWQEEINLKEKEIAKLIMEIAPKSLLFQEQQGLKSIDYKAITKNLESNELYIDYAKAGDYYYIFTLNKKEEIGFIQIDKNSTKKIDSIIMSFREDIKILDEHREREKELIKISKEKLAQLYELLIKNPLKDKLDNKTTLIISPDGTLRLLSFETLYNQKELKYLIESKEIRYIPSGKELVRLYKYSKNKISKTDEVIIFANPNFDSNDTNETNEKPDLSNIINQNIIESFYTEPPYELLKETKAEAEEISQIMPNTKIFEWNIANEINLLKVKEPKILHIATHGFFINAPNVPNPMLKSGIILSGANISSENLKGYGRVTALKLSGLDLRGTDLVVLSACETGLVDINNTDSISGLGKAFIQAGAKDVVMSLWSVDDSATRNLMVSFYKKIKAKENKKEKSNYAKALKDAKMEMIEKNRHPFYWGGFILLGL